MAQNVLNAYENVVSRLSVRRLNQIEEDSETEKLKRAEFSKLMTSELGNELNVPPKPDELYAEDIVTGEDDGSPLHDNMEDDSKYNEDEKIVFEHSLHDLLIHAEV